MENVFHNVVVMVEYGKGIFDMKKIVLGFVFMVLMGGLLFVIGGEAGRRVNEQPSDADVDLAYAILEKATMLESRVVGESASVSRNLWASSVLLAADDMVRLDAEFKKMTSVYGRIYLLAVLRKKDNGRYLANKKIVDSNRDDLFAFMDGCFVDDISYSEVVAKINAGELVSDVVPEKSRVGNFRG